MYGTGRTKPATDPSLDVAVKQRAMLLHHAVTALPSRSSEEVSTHLDWHLRYHGRCERKKELVVEWRAAKSTKTKASLSVSRVPGFVLRCVELRLVEIDPPCGTGMAGVFLYTALPHSHMSSRPSRRRPAKRWPTHASLRTHATRLRQRSSERSNGVPLRHGGVKRSS